MLNNDTLSQEAIRATMDIRNQFDQVRRRILRWQPAPFPQQMHHHDRDRL